MRDKLIAELFGAACRPARGAAVSAAVLLAGTMLVPYVIDSE